MWAASDQYRLAFIVVNKGKILLAKQDGIYMLKFIGDVRLTLCGAMDNLLTTILQSEGFCAATVDLTQTQTIDSTSLGLLARLALRVQETYEQRLNIVSTRPDINRILRSMGFHQIADLIQSPLSLLSAEEREVENTLLEEDALRSRVIEAHQIMMSMNDDNREKFKDLLAELESF